MKRFDDDLSKYPEKYLDCREGHLWEWITDYNILRGSRGKLQEFSRRRRCSRCKTEVVKTYDGQTGRVLRRYYDYTNAQNYLVVKARQFDAGQARLEGLRRAGII